MKTAQEWINNLNLIPHVEGGYFKEVLKAEDSIRFVNQNRALYTSIYFLLEANNSSNFHRLTADEVWYFHEGESLTIHMLYLNGTYEYVTLGRNVEDGDYLQYCVPKGTIFGSSVDNGYALVSCMVSPGFEYDDFELMSRKQLLLAYPEHETIINKLTRA